MIKVTFTVDEDFTERELKCVLAYADYACALFNLKQHMREFWETSSNGKTEDEIEKFTKEFYEILHGLPELD